MASNKTTKNNSTNTLSSKKLRADFLKSDLSANPNKKKKILKKKKVKRSARLDVNLIPKALLIEKKEESPTKTYALIIIGILTLILTGSLYFFVSVKEQNSIEQIKSIDFELQSLNKQIEIFREKQGPIITLQKQYKAIKQLLDQHIYWDKFFKLLEENTVADVYYTGFDVEAQNKVILNAIGRDFSAVAKQILAFEQASGLVEEVRVNSIDLQEIERSEGERISIVKFDVNLVLKPEMFIKTNK